MVNKNKQNTYNDGYSVDIRIIGSNSTAEETEIGVIIPSYGQCTSNNKGVFLLCHSKFHPTMIISIEGDNL
jgi:hypothetical protein